MLLHLHIEEPSGIVMETLQCVSFFFFFRLIHQLCIHLTQLQSNSMQKVCQHYWQPTVKPLYVHLVVLHCHVFLHIKQQF